MIRIRKSFLLPLAAVGAIAVASYEPATTFGPGCFNSAVFSQDGKTIATIDDTGAVEIWDVVGQKKLQSATLECDHWIGNPLRKPGLAYRR